MSGIDALLASLPPWTLVGGKGGVGKTTCAAALAVRSARNGVRTLVLSTDPAGTLADVLGCALGGDHRAVTGVGSLWASQLDAAAARTDFLGKWGDVLATIIDRGTYLDRDDIHGLVDATLPGIDETMALLALADLADRNDWQRLILDTAPTGHTLRLLALPETFDALIALLDTMQAKHRFMVSALMHRYRADEADAFIADLRAKVAKLRGLLTDQARMGVVLVSRPEPVVVAETVRYANRLAVMHVSVRAVVMNAADVGSSETAAALRRTRAGRCCSRARPRRRCATLGVRQPALSCSQWASSARCRRRREASNAGRAPLGRPAPVRQSAPCRAGPDGGGVMKRPRAI